MAGGNNMDVFGNVKPAKGAGEKKKRKRPSKKVPTTVLEASSNNFMNLVQKLTGSADELKQQQHAKSTTPSPYSSPSNHTSEPQQAQSFSYQQDHDSGSSHNYHYTPAPYSSGSYSHHDVGYGYDQYGSASAGGYVGSGSGVGGDDQDVDQYQSYSGRYNNADDRSDDHVSYNSSSRATENDVSPFSWRDSMNHNSTSNYWYHVDPMPNSMRAHS
jgi:hypothetical protein